MTNMNPVAENLTGWKLSESCGQPLAKIFNITDSTTGEIAHSPVDEVLYTGKPASLNPSTKLVSKNGNEYLIADSCAPIYNDQKQLRGSVLIFRDVTQEHLLQTQLLQSREMEAIGQLAGGLAHDINNMLSGILGGVEFLEMDIKENDDTREVFEVIFSSIDRASNLISQLLAFARKEKISAKPVNIHKAILNAISLLKFSSDPRVSISHALNSERSTVEGDLAQLQNVFLNLGINALRAMPEGGELNYITSTIELAKEHCENSSYELQAGAYIKVEVQDTGCGIPADDLERIFEPFYTTRNQGEGSGLGLSVAYGTITQHHGAISARSKKGEGTVFIIMLPLFDGDASEDQPATILPVSGTGRILVVDDEAVIRSSAKNLIEKLGYEVELAVNGKEALSIFKTDPERFDIVILDMIMPEMNGEDCFLAMKTISPNTQIILSSAFTRDFDLKDLKAKGMR